MRSKQTDGIGNDGDDVDLSFPSFLLNLSLFALSSSLSPEINRARNSRGGASPPPKRLQTPPRALPLLRPPLHRRQASPASPSRSAPPARPPSSRSRRRSSRTFPSYPTSCASMPLRCRWATAWRSRASWAGSTGGSPPQERPGRAARGALPPLPSPACVRRKPPPRLATSGPSSPACSHGPPRPSSARAKATARARGGATERGQGGRARRGHPRRRRSRRRRLRIQGPAASLSDEAPGAPELRRRRRPGSEVFGCSGGEVGVGGGGAGRLLRGM